jgi:hypothetical protein
VFNDVIFLGAVVVVLTIIWIGLNINIKIRRQKLKEIKKVDFSSYVTFTKNFKMAEKEEEKGNLKVARLYFEKCLKILQEEENPDDLIKDTLAEVQERIDIIDQKQTFDK